MDQSRPLGHTVQPALRGWISPPLIHAIIFDWPVIVSKAPFPSDYSVRTGLRAADYALNLPPRHHCLSLSLSLPDSWRPTTNLLDCRLRYCFELHRINPSASQWATVRRLALCNSTETLRDSRSRLSKLIIFHCCACEGKNVTSNRGLTRGSTVTREILPK